MNYEALLFDYAGTIAYEKKEAGDARFEIPPRIQEAIKFFYNGGYRLGIISNSHRYGDKHWLCKKLQDQGLLAYFEVVVSSGAWGIHKPDPLIFLRPLYFMGVHPMRALMVGNAEKYDIAGAKAIGMDALYVDLDKEGIWLEKLYEKLDDPNCGLRKPNLITDYTTVSGHKISCQVRHLSEPVKPGDWVIIGGVERKVAKVSQELTKENVIDAGRRDTVDISFDPMEKQTRVSPLFFHGL